eukprot:scaffold18205_cov29-Tisochrysis_lutea.AAC.3
MHRWEERRGGRGHALMWIDSTHSVADILATTQAEENLEQPFAPIDGRNHGGTRTTMPSARTGQPNPWGMAVECVHLLAMVHRWSTPGPSKVAAVNVEGPVCSARSDNAGPSLVTVSKGDGEAHDERCISRGVIAAPRAMGDGAEVNLPAGVDVLACGVPAEPSAKPEAEVLAPVNILRSTTLWMPSKTE